MRVVHGTLLSCVVLAFVCLGADERKNVASRALVEYSSGRTLSPPYTIECRPRRPFCGSLVTLRVRTDAVLPDSPQFRWTANGGRLYYDHLREVHWRAPDKPGTYRLAVEISSAQDARGAGVARAVLKVARPSTEGMVRIPAGTFLCGDVEGTRNTREVKTVQNANDEPFHSVHLEAYWIDRYPVTNRQYAEFLQKALAQNMARVEKIAVMGEVEGSWVPFYYFQPYDRLVPGYYETRNARKTRFLHVISWDRERFRVRPGHEEHPVVDVSWFGAFAYANFYGKRLPSEAEWEKAARGTDGRRYPWGDNLPTRYHVNLDLELKPVGTYSPQGDSPYGVADMLSAAFEWTDDWFNSDYYADYLAGTPHQNPKGPFWGSSHSIRGLPSALQCRVPTVDQRQPVTNRYNWRFEFLLGDSFGNFETTFRTVVRFEKAETSDAEDEGAGG